MPKNTPLIVIAGETASGKSALAMALAEQFDGELICADSWTVYRGFDIGTAKPSADDQARVRHHLLDIADPAEGFSAVEFKRHALVAIEDIANRDKLPVMVGGTGLYIDSVLYDYQFMPAPPPHLREELSSLSLDELRQRAHRLGLDTTDVDLRNKRRIIRLIESNGRQPTRSALRGNTLVMGIRVDRDHLRQRVEQRVDGMLEQGLEAEVYRLAETYGWPAEAMKGIGYREWQPYLAPQTMVGQALGYDGGQTLARTRERIIAATMGLAKRQRTWFKRNKSIHWLQASQAKTQAVDLVTTFVANQQR